MSCYANASRPAGQVRCRNPRGVPRPGPTCTYAQITATAISPTAELVTIAGQMGTRRDGTAPATLEGQIDVCLANMAECLAAAGATVHNLTRLVCYVKAAAHDDVTTPVQLTDGLRPWLAGHYWPVAGYYVVAGFARPEHLVAFEAMAVVPRNTCAAAAANRAAKHTKRADLDRFGLWFARKFRRATGRKGAKARPSRPGTRDNARYDRSWMD